MTGREKAKRHGDAPIQSRQNNQEDHQCYKGLRFLLIFLLFFSCTAHFAHTFSPTHPLGQAVWLKSSKLPRRDMSGQAMDQRRGERFPCHWCWNRRATRRYLQQPSSKGPGQRACLFFFPFPRHFYQASHVGVKYISKYWEQHCGGTEQEAAGSFGARMKWEEGIERKERQEDRVFC